MVVNRNKIVTQAQKYTAKGQLEKAVAEYRKLLKDDADDIRTWLKVGDLYTRIGARKEATETYLRVADKYTKTGFHLKAVAVYKQVLKLDPTKIEVFQFLADSYIHLGLTSEALIQLEQLADSYQRLGRSNRLLAVLAQMAEIDPKNIATRLRIAEHLSKENRTVEAVEQFRLTCEELRAQKRTEDFLKVAERLLYHDPSQIDIARETAALYLQQGMFKRALAKLQMCFVNEPRNLSTLEMLAKAFQSLGQIDKAVSVLKEMSTLLDEQGKTAQHQQVLETILKLDPTNEATLKELGRKASLSPRASKEPVAKAQAEAAPGNDGAEISTEISVSASLKFDEQIQQFLSEVEVLRKYDLKDRAIKHLESVFAIDYYNISAREQLKEILLEQGKAQEALEQLFILAEFFRKSQPEGSVYYLHEILRIDPSSARAKKMIIDIGGILPEDLDKKQVASTWGQAQPAKEKKEAAYSSGVEGKADDFAPEEDEDLQAGDEDLVQFEEDDLIDFVENVVSQEAALKSKSAAIAPASIAPSDEVEAPKENTDFELDSVQQELPDLGEELEEIEFYLEQGLAKEARAMVEELMERFPDDPRLREIAASLPIEEESYGASPEVRQSRIKMEEDVDFTDYDTHYDLGIAYKEMGLYEDAMLEFESASLDPKREALCQTMIGLCLICLNRIEESIKIFKKGLDIENINPQEKLGLLYELGKSYEQIGRRSQALECFENVKKQNPKFADVAARINSLKGDGG